ncbi:retron Eco8 family effector endonuclease [Yersinia pseudotuberculosis]|uniref:retron Eco8 family effector endonuclease n=1 Tax=Yersinia pseudotuberculosis TaxID=633 RepID=UPI0004F880DC|nr:retron Eco8 family effector endonuclease [Yersinia pseudotuberculosis]AIN14323.1 50S ribosome-binding GTPase family protein [Yersinia pseudotuberculosis]SUP90532.1 Predicted ATPase [Yersinia pseudotuberculosis]
MTILKIKITNLLSFDDVEISGLHDMNCIVGRNNVGKSNLLKALKFYYNRLEGKEELPLKLYSNYSYKGVISLTFDTTKIFRIARKQTNNPYFQFIMRKLIPPIRRSMFSLASYTNEPTMYTLSLNIYNDGKVKWSTKDSQILNLILYLFPFFHIEPRHMDLHDWDSLWDLVSRTKSFNLSKIDDESIIDFFDNSINSGGDSSYRKYIDDLNNNISTKVSTQKEKILSYIKAGLKGYRFEIDERDLRLHSDGTNSFYYIKTYLNLLITISRREYIIPFVFIDEPELGLHPKMNEVLVQEIFNSYKYLEGVNDRITRPKLFITTHSPNIVKEIIKRFRKKQTFFCFQKSRDSATHINTLNSNFDNESFINIFSDNEARLYFSDFILFVEGETELEVFGNMRLSDHFTHLKHIDIYKSSSNTIGERLNPAYANSSIPYLYLFDADKAISLKGKPGSFTINLKPNGNYYRFDKDTLTLEIKRNNLGFSKKHREIKNNNQFLINNLDTRIDVDMIKQIFPASSNFEDIFNAVKKRLLYKNIYLNRTTLEGCLVQRNSAQIFYDWLAVEYGTDIDKLLSRVSRSKFVNLDMLIDYFSVIFNGKTQTLVDYSSFNFESYKQNLNKGKALSDKLKKTSKHAKYLMNLLEKNSIANKHLDKTDGWTTSFLNYSVKYIENEIKLTNKTFGSAFRFYFPELYDIIRRLQPDSGGEI